MKCIDCRFWIIKSEKRYGDGAVKVVFEAPEEKGNCEQLKIETDAEFGCQKFEEGYDHVRVERLPEPIHKYFTMIPCPDCAGGTAGNSGGRGHRCAGTGLVRLYDDGYIGDEQTRLHPKEKPQPSLCLSCQQEIKPEWKACPHCGAKTPVVAETETPVDGSNL